MKKVVSLLLAFLLLLSSFLTLAACSDPAGGTENTTPADTEAEEKPLTPPEDQVGADGIAIFRDGKLVLVDEGKSNFKVIYAEGSNTNAATGNTFKNLTSTLRTRLRALGLNTVSIKDDSQGVSAAGNFEILIGLTNRPESTLPEGLASNEAVIAVRGTKVVITGSNDTMTMAALEEFMKTYLPEEGKTAVLPYDLSVKITVDFSKSDALGITYAQLADDIWTSFNEEYWTGRWVNGGGWWDAAEMLETYVDAYEQSRDPEIKDTLLKFANQFLRNNRQDWSYNDFNDDIMWACIAFARIAILTDNDSYAKLAKDNFDKVWARGWSDDLGGGVWWKMGESVMAKTSCINSPTAIAACLIGQLYNDESYYAKAEQVMAWMFDTMFQVSTGRVYDSINTKNELNEWASTYNQGTFIGACTLLYQKTGEVKYINYATQAANFAMNSLTNGGIIDNGEGNPSASNRDLPGFKGILTRWLYRYAKEVESVTVLKFLQKNAEAAYQNRNAAGLCWTQWHKKTPDGVEKQTDVYIVFGMSTCVALAFNCHQWW